MQEKGWTLLCKYGVDPHSRVLAGKKWARGRAGAPGGLRIPYSNTRSHSNTLQHSGASFVIVLFYSGAQRSARIACITVRGLASLAYSGAQRSAVNGPLCGFFGAPAIQTIRAPAIWVAAGLGLAAAGLVLAAVTGSRRCSCWARPGCCWFGTARGSRRCWARPLGTARGSRRCWARPGCCWIRRYSPPRVLVAKDIPLGRAAVGSAPALPTAARCGCGLPSASAAASEAEATLRKERLAAPVGPEAGVLAADPTHRKNRLAAAVGPGLAAARRATLVAPEAR